MLCERPNNFSISPKLQEHLCFLGQGEVFEMGEQLLKMFLGINMSGKQIQRVSELYGSLLEAKELTSITNEDGLNRPKESNLTYVMVDGSMIYTREEEWKEIKVGRVFENTSRVKKEKRTSLSDSLYVSHLGTHTDFISKLNNKIEHYTTKICIADGAKWIWNWASDSYPDMIQILDLFHALEKLSAFAKAHYTCIKQQHEWTDVQKALLLDNNVIENVNVIKTTTVEAKKRKEALVNYYTNNAMRMQYKTYINKGYLLGSGAIESAHRTIVQQRLKLSGQRWSINGAQNIVNLRCCQKSEKWKEVVELIKNVA